MASFDPVHRFSGAVRTVLMRALHFGPPAHGGSVHILRADARGLPLVDNSVDLVMTSPPYLTAIDYLRGHRLSLVWMGYTVRALRSLRATNIGSERACPAPDARVAGLLGRYLSTPDALGSRAMGVLNRYVIDLDLLMQEIVRVLKPNALATFVVADATLRGAHVDIAGIAQSLAKSRGMASQSTTVRALPTDRRYLPLPAQSTGNALSRRMRAETVLTLRKE